MSCSVAQKRAQGRQPRGYKRRGVGEFGRPRLAHNQEIAIKRFKSRLRYAVDTCNDLHGEAVLSMTLKGIPWGGGRCPGSLCKPTARGSTLPSLHWVVELSATQQRWLA
jgi:hypothetical protein